MKKVLLFLIAAFPFFLNSCKDNPDGTFKTLPIPPTQLVAITVSPTQINLSFAGRSANETGFKVECKTGTDLFSVISTLAVEGSINNNKQPGPNTIYTLRAERVWSGCKS